MGQVLYMIVSCLTCLLSMNFGADMLFRTGHCSRFCDGQIVKSQQLS